MMTLAQIVAGDAGERPKSKALACLALLAELPPDAPTYSGVAAAANTYALLELGAQLEAVRGLRTNWSG